ncbi:GRB2-associated-binding protein 2 [Cricetulus griseus]|uniref:GRB2-associated-binding protein 2 n=1 Tax=Cricetulus griseus TaxID=10029 RepID=G3HRQ7_CRIGR|nr:GRB2-associated-binding protein 2 [Cricetulus griseus]
MSGDPDVLEHYKNEHSNKPLWITNLNFYKASSTQTPETAGRTMSLCKTPVPSGTNSPALKKSSGNVDYLALDFQTGSLSPHCNPSTSSAMSDEEVHYVQVDKEKTQALQNTIQE